MDEQSPLAFEVPPPGAVRRFFNTCEDIFSIFFAFAWWLALTVVGAGLVIIASQDPSDRWVAIPWGIAAAIEGIFLMWLKDALEGGHRPFIPEFVQQQPRWLLLLRPVAAFWWLAHLAIGMVALFGVHMLVRHIEGASWILLLKVIGCELMAFSISHSSQLYLLLAVDAMHKDRGVTYSIWRVRFVLDGLAMMGALAYGWLKSSA